MSEMTPAEVLEARDDLAACIYESNVEAILEDRCRDIAEVVILAGWTPPEKAKDILDHPAGVR